jgi:Ca-activated chloride channel family protein
MEAKVVDLASTVQIKQTYFNASANPIETTYSFPINEQSSICGFEAEIDGRAILGVITNKEKAFDTYDNAIAQGNSAALLESQGTFDIQYLLKDMYRSG